MELGNAADYWLQLKSGEKKNALSIYYCCRFISLMVVIASFIICCYIYYTIRFVLSIKSWLIQQQGEYFSIGHNFQKSSGLIVEVMWQKFCFQIMYYEIKIISEIVR